MALRRWAKSHMVCQPTAEHNEVSTTQHLTLYAQHRDTALRYSADEARLLPVAQPWSIKDLVEKFPSELSCQHFCRVQ